jgi:hypothetical protein
MIEAVVAMGLLTIGLLSLAAVFTKALSTTTTASADITAKDKAFEAIESILAARDAKLITWNDMRNAGAGGIFVTGFNALKQAGPDGIMGTSDDTGTEQVYRPGPDQQLGTADDVMDSLGAFTREVVITDDPNSTTLRRITVTVRYLLGGSQRDYKVETLVTSFGAGQ